MIMTFGFGSFLPRRGRNVRLVLAAAACLIVSAVVSAQPPAGGAAPARGATASTAPKIEANLLQLMRGILYPSSNVIFAAQDDVGKFTPAADPATSPNPLTSTYGGWQAVENAALALAEAANILVLPGRLCANGKPVPVRRADWLKYVQGLREAGRAAYKAAQSKNQDAMVDAAGTVADACSACHDVYREKKTGPQDRCLP
jgi:Cytochrome C'